MGPVYAVPKHWGDLNWIETRHEFLRVFSEKQSPITIDFSKCEWIDLHPLVDTQLSIVEHCLSGGKVNLNFYITKEKKNSGRLIRFLIESGFLESLSSNQQVNSNVSCTIIDETVSINNLLSRPELKFLPQQALEQQIIVPCTYVNINTVNIKSRDDVYRFCQQLRQNHASRKRLDALRISEPLLHEARLFFNTVLPELIDNVRLHKRYDATAQFTFFMRLRRRDDKPPYAARQAAEPDSQRRSKFSRATEGYWEHDIIEIAFSDSGSSIQDTFVNAWRDKDNRKIPRKSGIRVDGYDGDYHILRSILEENRSSLPEEERQIHGLPIAATGLHSLRRSIEGANFSFAIRSGLNYIMCTPSKGENSDNGVGDISVKKGYRVEKTPGVHYIFRIATLADRPLIGWIDGIPKKGIDNDLRWWANQYPDRFDRVHFEETYRIPHKAGPGDIVVCRAHHGCPKHEIVSLIDQAQQREINIILSELPAPIALRMYKILQLLSNSGNHFCIPIITNNLSVMIAGNVPSQNASESFALGRKPLRQYWWTDGPSPIKNLKELFLCSRYHDSFAVWEVIRDLKGAFIGEPVKWSNRWVLSGGLLSFNVIYRSRIIRKILRRRLVLHAQALRAMNVFPSTEVLKHLTTEINEHSYLNKDGLTVVIDAVSVPSPVKNEARITG